MKTFETPIFWIATVAWLLLSGCSITRSVRPIGQDKTAIGVSVGGPVVDTGVPLPLPYASAYLKHGLTEDIDIDFGITIPVSTVGGLDVGGSYLVLDQDEGIPAIMVGGRIYFFGAANGLLLKQKPGGERYSIDPRVFEEFSSIFSWRIKHSLLVWTGAEFFAQLESLAFRPVVLAGIGWTFARPFSLGLEVKYMDFFNDRTLSPIGTYGLANYGAVGVQVGLTWDLGGFGD